jgi:hypothetical protein
MRNSATPLCLLCFDSHATQSPTDPWHQHRLRSAILRQGQMTLICPFEKPFSVVALDSRTRSPVGLDMGIKKARHNLFRKNAIGSTATVAVGGYYRSGFGTSSSTLLKFCRERARTVRCGPPLLLYNPSAFLFNLTSNDAAFQIAMATLGIDCVCCFNLAVTRLEGTKTDGYNRRTR